MLPHEEFLLLALDENCSIISLIDSLLNLYVNRVNKTNKPEDLTHAIFFEQCIRTSIDSYQQPIPQHQRLPVENVMGTCEFCDKPTKTKAADIFRNIKRCCLQHAKEVVLEQKPEYTETCPNCGCFFGIN